MLKIKTLQKLAKEQSKFDKFIQEQLKITDFNTKRGLIRSKIALLVEIGELANELKTFKHWKKQKDIDWNKAKQELIDCLCFYLGWAETYRLDFTDYKFRQLFADFDYNDLLLALFSETELLDIYLPKKIDFLEVIRQDKNKEALYRWLIIFEELCRKIGMTEQEIVEEYMKKNKINYQRISQNY